MRYRPLGRTGLVVSEIGFGAASWWGRSAFSEAAAERLVHAAVDAGTTLFDTGASYSHGNAESRLGRALKGRSADAVVIASKAGTTFENGRIRRDFAPAAIAESTERSLRRLQVDVLPLLQLHGPAIADLTDGLRETLAGLKARGLIRAVGVNSFDPAVIDHVIKLSDFDVVMIDYNVLRPSREPLIAAAAAAGKGVLAGMPLAMGHTGLQVLKLRAPRDLWYAARGLVRHRREVAAGARFGFLDAPSALAWVLGNPNIASAVVGTTRLEHLQANLGASGRALTDEVAARIRAAQARLSG